VVLRLLWSSGYSGYSSTSGYSAYSGYSGYSSTSGYSGYSSTSGYSGIVLPAVILVILVRQVTLDIVQ